MKKIIFLLVLGLGFISCEKEAIEPNPTAPTPTPIFSYGNGNDGTQTSPKFIIQFHGDCRINEIDSIVFTNVTKNYRKISTALNSWSGISIYTNPLPVGVLFETSEYSCTGVIDGWSGGGAEFGGFSGVTVGDFHYPEAIIDFGDSVVVNTYFSTLTQKACALRMNEVDGEYYNGWNSSPIIATDVFSYTGLYY